jgi:hypothetical protein
MSSVRSHSSDRRSPSGGRSRGFYPFLSPWTDLFPWTDLDPWTGAPCLRRHSRGTTWVEQMGRSLFRCCLSRAAKPNNEKNPSPASRTMRSRGICRSADPSSLRFSQWPLIRACPTVAISEGVIARISLVEQNDPGLFILGPTKPVDPPVLLAVQPCLIVHRRSLLVLWLIFRQVESDLQSPAGLGVRAFR